MLLVFTRHSRTKLGLGKNGHSSSLKASHVNLPPSPAAVTLSQERNFPLSVQHTSAGSGLPGGYNLWFSGCSSGGRAVLLQPLLGMGPPSPHLSECRRPRLTFSPGARTFLLWPWQTLQAPTFPPLRSAVITCHSHSFNPVCAGLFAQGTAATDASKYSILHLSLHASYFSKPSS